jgi:hypothetical protein
MEMLLATARRSTSLSGQKAFARETTILRELRLDANCILVGTHRLWEPSPVVFGAPRKYDYARPRPWESRYYQGLGSPQ